MAFLGNNRLFLRSAALCAVAMCGGFVLAASGCASQPVPADIPFTPTPVPQDVIGPGLTRSAADIVRQSQHIATIVASRPTEAPIAPAGLAAPAVSAPVPYSGAGLDANSTSSGLVAPTPVGVWWWREQSGDFTPAGVLREHPDGVLLDLLDGFLDYHPPMTDHALVGDYYRERVTRLLLDEVIQLMVDVDLMPADRVPLVEDDLFDQVGSRMGWEVIDAEAPLVRYWSLIHVQQAAYRLGGVVAFAPDQWPVGIDYGSPFRERLEPAEMVGSLVLERVQ